MPGFIVGSTGGGHSLTKGNLLGFVARVFPQGPNSRREYYYNYFWEVSSLFEEGFRWLGDAPLISLRDCTLPTFTVNKETHQGSSLEYKYAKSVTWEDIKVTWYDTIGLLAEMKRWRSNIWTPECGIADANSYKRESNLGYYLPTGKSVNHWVLKNSWPSQIRHGELTYTSSDVKIIEVTLTYDWAVESPA